MYVLCTYIRANACGVPHLCCSIVAFIRQGSQLQLSLFLQLFHIDFHGYVSLSLPDPGYPVDVAGGSQPADVAGVHDHSQELAEEAPPPPWPLLSRNRPLAAPKVLCPRLCVTEDLKVLGFGGRCVTTSNRTRLQR